MYAGWMNGPSMLMPSMTAPSQPSPLFPTTVRTRSNTFAVRSSGRVTEVARKRVTPFFTTVEAMVRSASSLPSMVSQPPLPWMCTSNSPGVTSAPFTSMRSASAGTSDSGTIPIILSSNRIALPSSMRSCITSLPPQIAFMSIFLSFESRL